MVKILAKKYNTREELEAKALGSDPKKDTIVGTRAELAKLHLSDQTTVHGLKCVITDSPTRPPPKVEKPDRGEIKPHGINLNE